MATVTQNGEDLFRQAIGAWESAMDSTVKMQEEYAQWLKQVCCSSDTLSELYNTGQSMVGEVIAKTQESIDEAVRVMNQTTESGVRLMQKSVEARQSDNPSDAKIRYTGWWESALNAMRDNTQAVFKANSNFLKTWSELAGKFNGKAAENMSKMAEKTVNEAEKMSNRAANRAKEHMDEMMNQTAEA